VDIIKKTDIGQNLIPQMGYNTAFPIPFFATVGFRISAGL